VELAERCARLLTPQDWQLVSAALGEMHDQLQEDLPDHLECEQVFSEMVATLIDRMGQPEIDSMAQAEIYSCSADSVHRDRASQWMKDRRHGLLWQRLRNAVDSS
jgi:hypothetical protein